MTASVSSNASTTKSRRAVLAGAVGGLGALAASAIGRVSPVQAANGDPVLLGAVNTATSATNITRSTSGDVFQASSDTSDCVNGYAQGGNAIYGSSGTGNGVVALTNSGIGVYASSVSGTGVVAVTGAANALALQTSGRARFSTSGVATINAGSTSKTITPGVGVANASFVLLTPKANIGTRALWFTTNPTADTFTIRMSSSRGVNTKIAWLLLG